MRQYFSRNREGLGVNILATAICGTAVAAFMFFHDKVPAGGWRTAYWVCAIGVGALGFILFLVPLSWRKLDQTSPPPEDTPVLSEEAKSLLRTALQDEYLTVLGTQSLGQRGTMYNANNGLIPCDGKDAIQSARYDSGMAQLLNAGYMTSANSEVFKLTADGIERASRLPAEATASG